MRTIDAPWNEIGNVVSAFEGRDYVQCGVWEEFTSFAKEFTQALFVVESQFERLIVKCKAVVESFHDFRNPPVTQKQSTLIPGCVESHLPLSKKYRFQ